MNERALVRTACPDDAAAIAAVHVHTWQRIYRGIMSDGFLDSLHPSQREPMWVRTLETGDQAVHVACLDGAVVGFSFAGASRNEAREAEIYAIYVHPDQWGTGLGRHLFAASCDAMRAQGSSRLMLWVASKNEQARTFYARAGMETDGATKSANIGGADVEEIRYWMDLS